MAIGTMGSGKKKKPTMGTARPMGVGPTARPNAPAQTRRKAPFPAPMQAIAPPKKMQRAGGNRLKSGGTATNSANTGSTGAIAFKRR